MVEFRSLHPGIPSVLSIRPTLYNKATLLHRINAFNYLSRVSRVLKIRNCIIGLFFQGGQ